MAADAQAAPKRFSSASAGLPSDNTFTKLYSEIPATKTHKHVIMKCYNFMYSPINNV